jgi:hypothetical protein
MPVRARRIHRSVGSRARLDAREALTTALRGRVQERLDKCMSDVVLRDPLAQDDTAVVLALKLH